MGDEEGTVLVLIGSGWIVMVMVMVVVVGDW